ncbi:reverse transcriptase domain-containing protein [Tanacetum coccineum]
MHNTQSPSQSPGQPPAFNMDLIDDPSSSIWDWSQFLDFNVDDHLPLPQFDTPQLQHPLEPLSEPLETVSEHLDTVPVNLRVRKRDPRMACSNFLAGRVPCACPELDAQLAAEEAEAKAPGKKKTRHGYIDRHRVCLRCANATSVVLDGCDKRYCQQCGKFHVLSDFDEGKRSCRRKLERHNNRRRRKPSDSKGSGVNSAEYDDGYDEAGKGANSTSSEVAGDKSFLAGEGHNNIPSSTHAQTIHNDSVPSVAVSGETQTDEEKDKGTQSPSYGDDKSAFSSMCTTGRISFKLYDWNPAEFPRRLRHQVLFEATNNEAEYEALIADLQIAEQMGVKNLQANVDSRLVANQVNGSYVAKESGMVQYLEKVKTLTSNFKEFSIKQVPRSENKKADALSKIASTSFAYLSKQVLVEELNEKSINEKEVLAIVEEEGHTWMTPICEYLTKEIIPKDKKKARAVRRKVSRRAETNKGMQQNLTPITSPWSFYKWGIDIARPFPEGPGKVKFLIVAIDYFTKWIKAKPVATITGNQVKKFVWDNIICRFGLPREIHPQTNGLVERANKSLGEGIKARLDERSKDWIGELSHVLWAHRTMIKSSNGKTPFSLTYGTEAIIPSEIGMPTLRTAEIDLTGNDEALEINLDLIEEKREQAAIQEVKSKAKMEKYYNSKVCGTSFKPGDMVYHNNDASHATDEGKLGPKWEGPYEVTKALGKGAYKLKDRKGNELLRTWNICNLKKCYIREV